MRIPDGTRVRTKIELVRHYEGDDIIVPAMSEGIVTDNCLERDLHTHPDNQIYYWFTPDNFPELEIDVLPCNFQIRRQ